MLLRRAQVFVTSPLLAAEYSCISKVFLAIVAQEKKKKKESKGKERKKEGAKQYKREQYNFGIQKMRTFESPIRL